MINIEANRAALLVMDFQVDVLGIVGDKGGPVVDRVANVIAAARAAQMPVIYVVVGFRAGYPEMNPRNATFSMLAKTNRFVAGTPGAEIYAAVKPHDGDVVVTKHRVSAFTGTDLDMILRAKGVDTLVLCGISTSGVVLSTVRHAADADYRIVVVKDGCVDGDDEVHRVLTEKVFARQTTVTTASEVVAALAK